MSENIKDLKLAIIGLGYVGLPLAMTFAKKREVLGFDINGTRIIELKSGKDITVTDMEMTRFMMSLDEAVDLVIYAFNNCNQGDIFVQKSGASTIETLVLSLKQIFQAKNKIKIMGTRHGEKKHETLLNREEYYKSEDLGEYFRVPPDIRGLNYESYFNKGAKPLSREIEYSSSNTNQLNQKELIEKLLHLDFIKYQLNEIK